jgi:urea transport system substrate-binding protein
MAGPDTPISHYVLTHYNALKATKAALEAKGEIDREALVDGLEGLSIDSPTGPVSIGAADHHVTLSMYLAKTEGSALVTAEGLGAIAPEAGCA